MEHVDRLGKSRQIDHPKRAIGIADPDFPNAGTDGAHQLPVIRITTLLHEIDLVPGLPPYGDGKGPQIIKRTTQEDNRFHARRQIGLYNILYITSIGLVANA